MAETNYETAQQRNSIHRKIKGNLSRLFGGNSAKWSKTDTASSIVDRVSGTQSVATSKKSNITLQNPTNGTAKFSYFSSVVVSQFGKTSKLASDQKPKKGSIPSLQHSRNKSQINRVHQGSLLQRNYLEQSKNVVGTDEKK